MVSKNIFNDAHDLGLWCGKWEDGKVAVCHFSYSSVWSFVFDSDAKMQKACDLVYDFNIHLFFGHWLQ